MSSSPPPQPPPAPQARQPRPRRKLRWPLRLGVLLVVLLFVPLLALWGAASTETGTRALWQFAIRTLAGTLSGDFAGGTLARGLRLHDLRYQGDGITVTVDTLQGDWKLLLTTPGLVVSSLQLGQVDVLRSPSSKPDTEPFKLPERLTLPLSIKLRDLGIAQLHIRSQGEAPGAEPSSGQEGEDGLLFEDIRINASSDGRLHHLRLEHAQTPFGQARSRLRVDGVAPFALTGDASLSGVWQEEAYRLELDLSGNLEDLRAELTATGDRLNGHANIDATPFADLPLRSAQVHIRHLNPRMFHPEAPQADLDIQAQLTPQDGTQELTLGGPVAIENATPGALDQQLLPLVSVRTQAVLSAAEQRLTELDITLPGKASLQGQAQLRQETPGGMQGEAALQATNIDLRALHGALQSTRLSGPITLRLQDDHQDIALDLTSPEFSARIKAQLTPELYRLEQAQLQAGSGVASFQGQMARADQQAYSVRGSLSKFEPADFFSAMQIKQSGIPSAHINLDLALEGKLQPELEARLNFNILPNSSYASLPMDGQGRMHILGQRLQDSDVKLSVAGNRASIQGGFGAPSSQLRFDIDAPQLARLGFGLAGLVQTQGTLRGSIDKPQIEADFRAERLVLADYRVQHMQGRVRLAGVPLSGAALTAAQLSNPDARILVELDARNARLGEIDLTRLQTHLEGSFTNHQLTLDATGKFQRQALALQAKASGRLRESPTGLAWEGTLQELQHKVFPTLELRRPLSISAAPGQVTLGDTQLRFEQALLELQGFEYSAGQRLHSRGSITQLATRTLQTLWEQFSASSLPLDTSLVLDGQWDLDLAAGEGNFRIDRRSGDLALSDGTALAINQLSLQGTLQSGQALLSTALGTERFGQASGKGQIGLIRSDGLLLPQADSSVSFTLEGGLPQLSSIAGLVGPSIGLEGSLALRIHAGGTLGQPVLDGQVIGDKLALTLYELGVKLRDGRIDIGLSDNLLTLRQFEFHGGSGTLRGSGQIPLDPTQDGLNASLVAERLQLMGDPSASLTLSGQANLARSAGQLLAKGKFTVDQALFSAPEQRAPSLDDDVVIYRDGKPVNGAGQGAANPFMPRLDIEIDLGRRFYFKGAGADLQLAGNLAIRSDAALSPQAFGTIRIQNGVYEAFGTELAIERGIINFDGPLNNPNINILAIRRKLEVEAGVQVTGTVRRPRMQLVSEPNVPDEEKLSWLVFGRGAGSEGAIGQMAAQGAALSLLNRLGGDQIAKGLGLDELSFGTSEYGDNDQVLNVGKTLSDRLHLGYEQSLAGAGSVLKLTYDLGRAWSVVLRGGQVTGMDVFYNKRFDRISGGSAPRRATQGQAWQQENTRQEGTPQENATVNPAAAPATQGN